MTTFSYIARNPAGERVTGRLAAASEQVVLSELHARDLSPVKVEEIREKREGGRGVSTRHLATAYRQLADLLRAGVPLLRGLRLLGRGKSNPKLASVMAKVAEQVADGMPLADALEEHDSVFPTIQVAMIRAGERGGFLEPVLRKTGEFLEKQADMQSKVTGNLIYPCLLLTVGAVVVVVALVVLVPKFAEFFAQMDLPLSTRILLGTSDILIHWWAGLMGGIAALVVVIFWLKRQPKVRRMAAVGQLRIPVVGPLVRGISTGRFTRILGTLLGNGIPLLQAMQISRDASGHVLLAEAVDHAVESVRAGETLTSPLEESGLFGEDIIEMISVGESANNLPEVLMTIADTIEKRVDRQLGLFVRLMEPIILLLLGGVVFFIFLALVVPMMRMSSAI